MFSFFKKNKVNNTQNLPEQIQQLLKNTQLYGTSLLSFVEKQSLDGEVLNMQLRIKHTDDTQDLEAVYHQLQQHLYPLGIKEVNFNVVVAADDKAADVAIQSTPAQAVQLHTPKQAAQADNTPTDTGKKPSKQSELSAHPRIRHIIAIASGKGGVGKSTTTANLALALQRMGKKVGVLDADIYGPSMSQMLGVSGIKPIVENDQFVPVDAQGIAMLSIGNLLDGEQTPVAWRGIKAVGALMQLYSQTNWPPLDYLLIDMPPGTGDIQLTIAQKIPVSGALIVTTPQHIALLDAQKGIEMFVKTDIAVLGVVENMALHTCSQCGHSEAIFGAGGGEWLSGEYHVPLLGQLPLVANIRAQMDAGTPQTMDTHIAMHYDEIANRLIEQVSKVDKKSTQRFF